MEWFNAAALDPLRYKCGHCGDTVASAQGFFTRRTQMSLRICPSCHKPTFFHAGDVVPGPAVGEDIQHLPDEVEALYNEARRCCTCSCFTSAVLTCRKLLMHIAVQQGAKDGLSFVAYVEHLSASGYVPPNGRVWVDYIRTKGNEANHEIALMTEQDAENLIVFSGMLLKFIYEMPNRLTPVPTVR